MANYRNAAFTIEVFALTPAKAHKKARRIAKHTGIRKVHAYSVIRLNSTEPKYLVDIILKESITLPVPERVHRWASSVGTRIY